MMARRAGIKVKEFGFGLPPRIWGKQVGETLYSINWIPLGGFVRMLGQDDFDYKEALKAAKSPRSFENKTPWQRTKVLCAGVAMNLILALFLLSVAYTVGMQPIIEGTSSFEKALQYKDIVVKEIEKDSLAQSAGLQINDVILAANGKFFSNVEEVSSYTKEHAGQRIDYRILRNEEELDLSITPNLEDKSIGIVMLQEAELKEIQYPFYKAPLYALEDIWGISKLTVKGLADLVKGIFSKLEISDDVTGPIGILQLTHSVMRFGFIPIIQFTAILSVSLAVINILPFPALDGGRLLFVAAEAVRREKLSPELEGRIHLLGFLLLLALIVAVSYQDILRIFG